MSFIFSLSTTCATYIATCLTLDTPRFDRPGLRIPFVDALHSAAVTSIMPSHNSSASSSRGPARGSSKIVSVIPCQVASWASECLTAWIDVICTELVPLITIGISSYIGQQQPCEQIKNTEAVMNLSTN